MPRLRILAILFALAAPASACTVSPVGPESRAAVQARSIGAGQPTRRDVAPAPDGHGFGSGSAVPAPDTQDAASSTDAASLADSLDRNGHTIGSGN